MKKYNQNEKRNYKPIKIGESLKDINQKLLYKYGKLDYIIFARWPEIVGVFFVKHSQPEKIISLPKMNPDYKDESFEKILHVNVTPAAAVEFQHFKNKVIEKINSFFGFKAIHDIKIHQKLIKKNTPFFEKQNNSDNSNFLQKKIKIKNTIQKINDKELEDSLLNLGVSVSKNEEV